MIDHSGPLIAQRGKLKVISCKSCRFYHLDPIPDDDSYYTGEYYDSIKPLMAAEYAEDKEWWNEIYGDWLSIAKDLVPNHHFLDIGAGTGDFVRAALARGWTGNGAEPDYAMAQRSALLHGDYRSVRDIRGLGMISAHWVLEHLPDPADFVKWAYGVLAPGGILMITIPNDFTPIQFRAMQFVKRPYYWINEHHTNYFNANSFVPWIEYFGFRVLPSGTYGSWQPELQLINGRDYIGDDKLGREIHAERMRDEIDMGKTKRRLMMRVRGVAGIGRDLTYFIRRA